MKKAIVFVIIITLVITSVGISLYLALQANKQGISNNNKENQSRENTQQKIEFVMAKSFETNASPVEFTINAEAKQYELPLNLNKVQNLKTVESKITIPKNALTLLKKNGFVVIETPKEISGIKLSTRYIPNPETITPKEDFFSYYLALETKELPKYITTDSILHFYHIFFEKTLIDFEKNIFTKYIKDLTDYFYNENLKRYSSISDPTIKETAKRNLAFFGVAELLQDENFKVDESVKDIVSQELDLINAHEGFNYSKIFFYKEDYSQYVPRGHYTESEALKSYFKTLMWYGRITFLLNGSKLIPEGKSDCGYSQGIISEYDSKIQTLQGLLIAYDFLRSVDAQNKWSVMYEITSFLVGFSDDITPYEYASVLNKFLTDNSKESDILSRFNEIKEALQTLKDPTIYSGLGDCKMPMPYPPLSREDIERLKETNLKLLKKTKGMRFLGQRFTLDSYLFSRIVSPFSGEYTGPKTALPTNELPFTYTWFNKYTTENRPFTWAKTIMKREVRAFPRGLDLMALLGSDRAYEILKNEGDTNYSDYDNVFNELKNYIESLPQDEWSKTLYNKWLSVLTTLFLKKTQGLPTFMKTSAYSDKLLQTALSSWTELRHDTVLYVKQSYTMAEKGEGGPEEKPYPGYVEPVPEFYIKLLELTRLTKDGLTKIQDETSNSDLKNIIEQKIYSLDSLETLLKKLLSIVKKELENTPLDDSDYYTIKGIGTYFDSATQMLFSGETNLDLIKPTLVVDVHTDGNTKLVVEEGLGYVNTILVVCPDDKGNLNLAIGPVFSYYEFKYPIEKRLTDEEWRDMLEKGSVPPKPKWVSNFSN
jgi:flagellar basal body-associated protein FliL